MLQCLLPEVGKLSLIARGALRSKKRFGGGVLQPTHHVEIHYTPARNESGLANLLEARLINDFAGLRKDFDRLDLGLQILHAVDRVSHEGDVHLQGLYDLTGHALRGLETAQNLSIFKIHFGLRFLMQQGILEQQAWMQPYLTVPMASTVQLTGTPWTAEQLSWTETTWKLYLNSAAIN